MVIDKVVELYRETCWRGLSISIGFSLTTIPGPDLAGRSGRHRRDVPEKDMDRGDAERTLHTV